MIIQYLTLCIQDGTNVYDVALKQFYLIVICNFYSYVLLPNVPIYILYAQFNLYFIFHSS